MRCNIEDLEAVERVIKNPSVWDGWCDDFSPAPGDYSAKLLLKSPWAYVLMPNADNVSVFVGWRPLVCELHTFVLPEGRGLGLLSCFKDCKEWLRDNTKFKTIVTYCAEKHDIANTFARFCGFKLVGSIKNGYRRNGHYQALMMYQTGV